MSTTELRTQLAYEKNDGTTVRLWISLPARAMAGDHFFVHEFINENASNTINEAEYTRLKFKWPLMICEYVIWCSDENGIFQIVWLVEQ